MKPNRPSMKKLAVIVAVVTIIGFAYYPTSPRFATGTSETEALGYWVKPNGLREWEGHFAGEHALFRLDEDGSAHVFARGLYSDQFVDVFKTGIKVSNGTNIQPFDHGKWRITNDERGLTLDLNFGHNWHRFEIQAADASTLALRPTITPCGNFSCIECLRPTWRSCSKTPTTLQGSKPRRNTNRARRAQRPGNRTTRAMPALPLKIEVRRTPPPGPRISAAPESPDSHPG